MVLWQDLGGKARKMAEDTESEFCVVMTLKRKDGSSCDLRVYIDDDPHEVAKEYVHREGLSKKAVTRLSSLIKTKRDEAMTAHHDGKAVINASSIDDSQSLSMMSAADTDINERSVDQSLDQSSGRRASSASKLFLSIPSHSTEVNGRLDNKHNSSSSSGNRGSHSNDQNEGPFLEDKPSPDGVPSSNEKYSRWIDKAVGSQLNSTGGVNVSPGSGGGTPRASEQRAASERLHNQHASKMDRQRRLSMSVVKRADLDVINSDFRNQIGHRQSVSGNSKEEREAALSQIYYDGLKRQSLKEKAIEKIRADSEAKRYDEEKEYTFKPTIFSHTKSPRRDSIVNAPRQSNSEIHRPPINSTGKSGQKDAPALDTYDVYDWLAYHSRVDSQNKFLVKREEIEAERAQTMNFSPKINDASEAMANKKRSEKLRKYATAGYSKEASGGKPMRGDGKEHDAVDVVVPDEFKKDSPPRLGAASDESISEVRTEDSHEDDISEGFGVQSEFIHNGDVKTDGAMGLSFQRHHQHKAFASTDRDERDGQESVESSIYSSEVLDVTNPFDLVDHQSGRPIVPQASTEAVPSYSPSAYIRSQQRQHEAEILAHDVDFDTLEPSKRADALFEYLYHGRMETERVRAEATEKYQEKYSFRPKISRFTNSTVFKKLLPNEFFDKMYRTQKRKEIVEKKPESRKLKEFEVDAMVLRLSGTNLQRYVDRKAERKAAMDTTILDRSSICHRFQPRKTRDLTKKARETSSSEIFDVLLMSVEHYHHTKTHAQEDIEEKLEAMPDERERRHSDTSKYHNSLEQRLDKVKAENHETIMEIENDLFGPEDGEDGEGHENAQSDNKKSPRHDSVSDFAPSSELKGYKHADEGIGQLLDTVHAQPRFLQPLALAEAIEIVIRDARPHRISREDFIDRVEVLINSGVGPPINTILIAPQRPLRYKHSKEIEVDRHVKPPTLVASKASTRMAANRTRANISDPMKYAKDKSEKLEKLRKFHEKKEMEGCTFQPSIKTDDSWNVAKKSHDRHYHDVVYKPPKYVSKPALFKRDTVMRPTTSSIKHRASDDQLNRIKARASREHDERQAIDHVMDEEEVHEIHRPMEFIYVDSPPPGAKKTHQKQMSDYEEKLAKVKEQHDREYSQTNAHSAAHMPVFRSHAGHTAEDVDEAAKLTERKHVADDFEKLLVEVEGKIREAVDVGASTQSTSTASSSGYLARHEAISGGRAGQ